MPKKTSQFHLPKFSVERPVTVVMILLALLVVGTIAYQRIEIALFPQGYERKMLGIYVSYPNATPIDVEQKITKPIEDILGTVNNISSIETHSHSGSMWARVEFQPNTDLKVAYAELRDRMDRVMPDLPDDVERIWVRKWDENDIPILYLAATASNSQTDPYTTIDTYLRPALQRIDGVGNVNIWGAQAKEINIDLDLDRIRSHGINLFRLTSQLRAQNFSLPGGYVMEGDHKIYVRSMGKFTNLQQIENLVIDPVHDLRLKDIATVALQKPKRQWVYRIDKKPAIGIEIMRTSSGNIADISRKVRAALKASEKIPQMKGIKFQIFFDQGQQVTRSINNLKNSALWGGILASIVLFVFLRAIRMTAILTLAIPLSLLATITTMYFVGWSLNMATMMGLLLSIGMVVDNSIVIVENIYRRRQEGEAARPASINGAGEVGLAITMATLTSVVVFLPLILMSNSEDFSFWMLRIGIPVICSLLASLFIALVFIPLAAERLSRGKHHNELRVILAVRGFYLRALNWVLAHRVDATLLVIIAMATIVYPMHHIKIAERQGRNNNNIRLRFDMPSGQTIEQAEGFFEHVENTILEKKKAYNVRSLETRFRGNQGRLQVIMKDDPRNQWFEVAWDGLMQSLGFEKAPLTRAEIEADIKKRLKLPPGYTLHNNWGGNSDQASLSVNLYGEDTQVLSDLSLEVERRLKTIPDVLSVDTDMERGDTELQVKIKRQVAHRLGIDPREISGTISYSLRGVTLGRYYTADGHEFDIRMQKRNADEQTLDDLRNLTFQAADGTEVPLESLASLYVAPTLGDIRRTNRETSLSVSATVSRADMRKLFTEVDKAMKGFQMPAGYHWNKGENFRRLQQSNQSQFFAVILSISFVFFLMGVLFESFVLPLSVIIAVPFSFLGVYWTLFLTGTPMDIMSMIGSVILIGVVVNNGIVLVDLTNRLRQDGVDRLSALLQAGKNRFRPILMTTFTTVFGLIPMAVGNSNMVGMPYAPLGRTMIGGLLAATVLTLLIVPLFYTWFDDLRLFLMRAVTSAFRSPASDRSPLASDSQNASSRPADS